MARINCPRCQAEISDQAANCPECDSALNPARTTRAAAIRSFGGKLRAGGTVIITLAVITTVSGLWWGPALFLPGIAVFMFGMSD